MNQLELKVDTSMVNVFMLELVAGLDSPSKHCILLVGSREESVTVNLPDFINTNVVTCVTINECMWDQEDVLFELWYSDSPESLHDLANSMKEKSHLLLADLDVGEQCLILEQSVDIEPAPNGWKEHHDAVYLVSEFVFG